MRGEEPLPFRGGPIAEHDGSRPEKVDKKSTRPDIRLVVLYGGLIQQLTIPTTASETRKKKKINIIAETNVMCVCVDIRPRYCNHNCGN